MNCLPLPSSCEGHTQTSLKFGFGRAALRGLLSFPILNLLSLRISTQCNHPRGLILASVVMMLDRHRPEGWQERSRQGRVQRRQGQ